MTSPPEPANSGTSQPEFPPGYHTPPAPLPPDYPGYPTSVPPAYPVSSYPAQPVSPYGWQQPVYVMPVHQVTTVPTSSWATASLVLSIIGVLTFCCALGLPSIAAVICGHVGMDETATGAKGGRGMAVTGLIVGYLTAVPAIFVTMSYGFDKIFND